VKGTKLRRLARDEKVLDWVRKAHETSTWTTSVCFDRSLV